MKPRGGFAIWAAACAAYAFLYVPLAVVVAFSFNDSALNAGWVGFTTAWYRRLFTDADMLLAARNSLAIALLSSCVSTVLGAMAGIAMQRYRMRWLAALALAPVAMPEILLGVSLLLFFRQVLDLTLGFFSILAAHVTFSIGFVALIVRVRVAALDPALMEAARGLGATPWAAFRRVLLPLIAPALVAGALIAFTLSIDDFVVTFFVAGVGVKTLPLQIYSMIKVAVSPEVNAISTLLMALNLAAVLLALRAAPELLRRRR